MDYQLFKGGKIMNIKNIPKELKELPQWLCWRYCLDPNIIYIDGRGSVDIGGETVILEPPYRTFHRAVTIAQRLKNHYTGFVLTEDDPYGVIGLSDCFHLNTKKLLPWAKRIVKTFNSFTEIMPRRKGVNILTILDWEPDIRFESKIQFYTANAFIPIRGNYLKGTSLTIKERKNEVIALYKNMADEELINNIRIGIKGKEFVRLFNGDWQLYYKSKMKAEIEFCRRLARETYDDEQIDRIFRESDLMSDKWDKPFITQGVSYGQSIIWKARQKEDPVLDEMLPLFIKHNSKEPETEE